MNELTALLIEISGGNTLVFALMGGIMLLTSAICFFVLAGSAGYLTILLSIAACAYPVARVKAIGTPFVREENLNILFEAGHLSDALSRIQATGFLTGTLEHEGVSIEEMLEQEEMNEFPTLLSSMPTDFAPFFTSYQNIFERRMIKRLIRMIHNGNPQEEIIQRVRPTGILTQDLITRIATGTSLDDGLHLLTGTPYDFLAAHPLHLYHEQGTLLPFEIALDRYGSDQLRQSCSLIRSQLAAPFRDLVSTMTDIQNIRTLIRAKHAGLSPTYISSCFLDGGARFPGWRLIQLNEMMSVPDLVGQLSGTAYIQLLQPLLPGYPSPDSLIQFDLALDRFFLQAVARISLVYYYTG
ncbi:MAG: hypothetical protein CVV33_07715, partial [Methanomicrobiales archaeon HGW-Methanomicrobiales-4]